MVLLRVFAWKKMGQNRFFIRRGGYPTFQPPLVVKIQVIRQYMASYFFLKWGGAYDKKKKLSDPTCEHTNKLLF
jgi:hypothetical protein